MSRTSQRLLSLCLCLLIPYCAGQASGGYAAYAGAGSSSASTGSGSEVLNSVPSGGGALAPAPPLAPPRVPLPETANIVGPSLGYRPPPPPVRRDAESSGKCSFGRCFDHLSSQLISLLSLRPYKTYASWAFSCAIFFSA